MSVPLYFLPKVTLAALAPRGTLSRSLMQSRGLGEVWRDVGGLEDLARCELSGTGPGGSPGLVLAALSASREPPRRIGYYPAEQDWTQIDEGLWIGVDKHDPPRPEEMRRAKRFPGHKVRLGDWNEWEVPILRYQAVGSPALPRDMHWENGQFVTRLRAEFDGLWKHAERIGRYFFGAEGVEPGDMTLEEGLTICMAGLALNYRVGPNEQRLLHLVTTTNCEEVLGAMIDMPTWMAEMQELETAQKKSEPHACGLSSPPGDSGEVRTIDPATLTSES